MKILGPGNGLHRFEFAKVAGPSFGCLKNKRLIEAFEAGPYAIRQKSAKIWTTSKQTQVF